MAEGRSPRKVLIAGSYPPAMSAAADATIAAARRELAEGRSIVTVSPRPSGASITAALAGPGTGRRLEQIRRQHGADGLVLSIEPGLPLLLPPHQALISRLWPVVDRITLALLRPRLKRFDHVTVLVTEPSALGTVTRLGRCVDEVALSGPAAAAVTEVPGFTVRVVDAPSLGEPYQGLTTAGPPEPAIMRVRGLSARTGRRILGPVYTPVRLLAWPFERLIPAARRRLHQIQGRS